MAGTVVPQYESHTDVTNDRVRRISVFGSTGSVGRVAVGLLEDASSRFEVDSLVAYGSNIALLAEQAKRLNARCVVVADPSAYPLLKEALQGANIAISAGSKAVIEAAGRPVDLVVSAIVGAAGLAPTLAAIRAGSMIALANKECLVHAGELFMAEAARYDVSVIPVDSEHSAIFQVLAGNTRCQLERIILTASGGPFRTWSIEQMRQASIPDALTHPNFTMGQKISIDSATMVNKGFELIEAHHLFGIPSAKIDVLVHLEQVIHGLVEFSDGSVLAQLGIPDMTIPVAVALAWPQRFTVASPHLDLGKIGSLNFEKPDEKRFPALQLARQALDVGSVATCVMGAANEVAVEAFLDGKIDFLDIVRNISLVLDHCGYGTAVSFEQLDDFDVRARRYAKSLIARSRILFV